MDALLLMGTHVDAVGVAFNVVDGTPLLTSTYIRLLAKMLGCRVFAVPGSFLKVPAILLMLADQVRGHEAMVTPNSLRCSYPHLSYRIRRCRRRYERRYYHHLPTP